MDKYYVKLFEDRILVYSKGEFGIVLVCDYYCPNDQKIQIKILDDAISYPRARLYVKSPDGGFEFSHIFDEVVCENTQVRNRIEFLSPNADFGCRIYVLVGRQ